MRFPAALILALFTLLATGPARAAAEADLILVNGQVITVDDQFRIVEALAVAGARIIATGTGKAMRALAGPRTKVLDLKGRTVIPGLIDNHNHFIRATQYWASEARLDGVTSRQRALSLIRAKAAALPANAWVFSLGGWYEDQFTDAGGRGFSLQELDRAVPDRPLFLQAKYDHAYVNSAWLRAMDIPLVSDTPGEGLAAFVVRDAHGRASGRLNGGFPMIARAIARFPKVSEAEQRHGIESAMAYYNAIGLTTVYDPGGLGIRDASYARIGDFAARRALSLRVFYTLWGSMTVKTPTGVPGIVAKIRANRPFQGNEWFDRIAFGEVYYPPFHWDSPVRLVHPTAADIEAARAILSAAAGGGWPVQTHAIQPANIDRIFDLMEEINRRHPLRALRWSITHADNVGAAQIARARRLGVNFQIRSQKVIGGVAEIEAKFGPAARHMPPLRLLQDSGITFGLGTDGTKAAQINPFVTLWWAITGRMLNGAPVIAETLSRREALIAHTRSNALMMFQENNLGALKPGLLADMLILEEDYLGMPVDRIKDIRPAATIVGGRLVSGAW